MEVHAHPHAAHGKKNWKNYFWEFLMLFLAVFCGFLAEYQLEHKIEKERAKKLMYDMVENLKYDTTRIGLNAPDNSQLKKDLDSLRYEIKESIRGKGNNNRLYYFFLKTGEFGQSTFNKAAITQLKNSGQLRLIKNDALVNEMLDYYERKVKGSEDYCDDVSKAMESMTEKASVVFKTTLFDFVRNAPDTAWRPAMSKKYEAELSSVLTMKNLDLLSRDSVDLEKLHSAVLNFEWSIINYNRFLNFAREGADKLMLHIEEVYQQ